MNVEVNLTENWFHFLLLKRTTYYLDDVGEADPENEIADWDCSSSRMPSRIESRVIELSGIILEWFGVKF